MSYTKSARRICVAALGLAGVLAFALAGQASAETFTPTNTTQLEEAVSAANANTEANTIVLAGGTTYLPAKTLTFKNTHGLQTLEGATSFPGSKVEGGNLEAERPEMVVVDPGVSALLKNISESTAGFAANVAVEDLGTLTVESSTIAGNNATGVLVGPGASSTYRNSTISDNEGVGVVNDGTANFFNSTVAFNTIDGVEDNVGGLSLTNTIVAESGRHNCTKPATSSDHSLDSDGTCGVEASGKNPLLGPLLFDGGPTPVHSLQPGSPAIDAGDPATCLATDQEGQPRPDVPSTPCDIGADEWNNVAPTISVPSEVTAEATGPSGAAVKYTASASSSVAKVHSFSCSPSSGSTFPIGETTVNCTATDGHGNVANASFKVTVKSHAPELHLPENITATAEGPSGAKVSYTVTATSPDYAAAELRVSCAPESGSTFPIGETTVNCTATDPSGHSTSGSFKVTVKATELEMKEWLFKGSLTDAKLGQTLFTLPSGARFNGHAAIPGALEGNTSVPAFKSTVKLFGFIPITFGFTFTETEPVKGTISNDPNHAGNVLIKATAKDNIGITSVGLLGLTIPTACTTNEAVAFPLEASETASQFETSGATFTGTTKIPGFFCHGGILGSIFGTVLKEVLSGPNNPFTLTIEP